MKRAEPGWLVLALAGIAAAIGSFLPFYTFGADIDLTVWSRSLFPTATLIPVLVLLIGLEALFVLVMGYEPRSPFLNFTWSQARLAGGFFAIVLALSFLVQGRAGGDLGSGYVILSLSTLATFGGAVMTRRAELARGRDEIVTAEHPWRAAALRWRRALSAKAEAFAAGANQAAPRVQPAPVSPDGEKEEEKPAEKPEEPAPEPTPVPRLSAVQSEPEAEEKPTPAAPARKPAKRAPKKKAAARKVPKTVEAKGVEQKPEEPKPAEPKTAEPKTEQTADEAKTDAATAEQPTAEQPTAEQPTAEQPTAERPTDGQKTEPKADEQQTVEHTVADTGGDTSPAEDGDGEPRSETLEDDDDERERPAAPG